MEKKWSKSIGIFFTLILILAVVIYTLTFLPTKETTKVMKVIDGDTIVVAGNRKIRLIGINAPEKSDFHYEEAKNYLCSLVCNKTVILERDRINKDKYGRFLRYVWVEDMLVNEELLKAGYAHTYILRNRKYENRLIKAEIEAMDNKRGIWNSKFGCIVVHELNFDAKGNDCKNPNDEFVVFRNFCNSPVNMSGYKLKDSEENFYVFKNVILGPEEYITLHSGRGIDNETDLFWNSNKSCPAVWNNDGDKLFMRDRDGYLILYYEY